MAKMTQIVSNLNENFFDFFAFAVKKFLWVKFSSIQGAFSPGRGLKPKVRGPLNGSKTA
jgi:hypothetical protein